LNRVQRLLDEALHIDDEILPMQLRIGLAVNLAGQEVTGGAVIEDKEAGFDNLLLLRELDCDVVQGYLYSRPLPEQELLSWLLESRPFISATVPCHD
jgi:predicted signal transduction protein with EAL and GGDEF domain